MFKRTLLTVLGVILAVQLTGCFFVHDDRWHHDHDGYYDHHGYYEHGSGVDVHIHG